MKKIPMIFLLCVAFGSMTVANAALLQAGSTGTITVTSGCFAFVDACVPGGLGIISDNSSMTTTNNIGSAIAGDGIIGRMNFTVGADGNSFNITSYNMDTYQGTAMGDFNTRMVNTAGAVGSISDTGAMVLDLTGRTGIGQFTFAALGEQAWNIDSHNNTTATAMCFPGSGLQTLFTSGSSSAIDCATGATAVSLSGSVLVGSVAAGVYTGAGTIVSAGNMGKAWGNFDGSPYSEIYNITVTGTAVPVPADVWFLGSGLLGLVGFARRKQG